MLRHLLKFFFIKRSNIRSDIYVTDGGGFGMKSNHLFKNKKESLELLDKINTSINNYKKDKRTN